MRMNMKLITIALATAAVSGCTDSITAPATLDTGAALAVEGRRSVEYSAQCEMRYYEVEAASEDARERILGAGTCRVDPFGRARMTMEAWESYTPGGFVLEGALVYHFDDGSRLRTTVRIAGGEVIAFGPMMFTFEQRFVRGAGRFARVNGGEGYGEGRLVEHTGAMFYRSSGHVLFEDLES